MLTRNGRPIALVPLLAAAAAATTNLLPAQESRGAPATVPLAFGYECDDWFLVRNDGAEAVTIEYALAGSSERSALHLEPKESVEISSPSKKPLELWVNDEVAARAYKGNRTCAARVSDQAERSSNPVVVVRPIEQTVYVEDAYLPPEVVYIPSPRVYRYSPVTVSFVVPLFSHFGGYGRVVRFGRG